jgi:monothiol glutaredoxin
MPTPRLDDEHKTEGVLEAQDTLHRETVDEVRNAVERESIVVVGMSQNPVVKKVRRALEDADLPFTYLEYGSYLGEWRRRLAIKLWSGWPTFPQVFVRGVLIGGNEQIVKALADGSLRERLQHED